MSVTTKYNFVHAGPITLDIIDTLLANGFKAIFPVAETPPNNYVRPTNLDNFSVTLEAQGAVDPLNEEAISVKQPWRINFTVYDNATMNITVGSPVSLGADGKLPAFTVSVTKGVSGGGTGVTTTEFGGIRGIMGAPYTPPRKSVSQGSSADSAVFFIDYAAIRPHWNNVTEGFINRKNKVWVGITTSPAAASGAGQPAEVPPTKPTDPNQDISASFPMSYHLIVTDRGIFLAVWEGAISDANGKDFSWLLVQRPVDRDSGETIVDGKAPVFCVNSVGNIIRRFVVREQDRTDVSASVIATVDSADASAIINSKKQVGVSEDNTYVVNFPSRLNTPRYAYTYELDMIGYTSASVVSNDTEIPVKLYGEDDARTYFGMFANQLDNNGMRIVALQTGGGV